jgi:L-lactate dehydrogenase complex protein LldE
MPRVALLVTCLVDFFRPSIARATLACLRAAGCRVDVPLAQVCCGQPAYNAGDEAVSRDLARQVIDSFEGYD